MSRSNDTARVLAIDPGSRGFGFAVLECPERLIDWGVVEVKDNSHLKQMKRVANLLERYEPHAIVLEDITSKRSHRCKRIRTLIRSIAKMAGKRKVRIRRFSPLQLKHAFAPASNKDQIAEAIISQFPELAPRLPQKRKSYTSEHYQMGIFDAVALGLTFFALLEKRVKASTDQTPNGQIHGRFGRQ